MMEMPNGIEAAGVVSLTRDGIPTLISSNGILRVRIEGNPWARRITSTVRRWLRRPAPVHMLVWELARPVGADEATAMVTTSPDVTAVAAVGPEPGEVRTIADAGADRIQIVVMCTQ